jgi:hypothetical protein
MFGFENVRKSRHIINDLLTFLLLDLMYVLNYALFVYLRAGSFKYIIILMLLLHCRLLYCTVKKKKYFIFAVVAFDFNTVAPSNTSKTT